MALADREANPEYRAPRAKLQLSDFNILGRIGDGSFSTVILAQLREGQQEQYAIKIVNKHLIMRNKMVDYVRNERNILDQLSHDGVVRLMFTFQDADSLYFGCEYCPGGDLYEQITKRGHLSIEDTKFYAAEVVQVLEYLRSKQVVHRDLKPENLLLTADGHLKLTDFGSAKAFFLPPVGGSGRQARTTSFVGTAEYVSPEVLSNSPLSYPADLWAVGCCIFQMIAGRPPFKAGSEYLTFQKVAERDFEFPEGFPEVARSLVDGLLVVDPEQRLGANDMEELKEHPFFAGIDWEHLRQQKAPDFVRPSAPEPDMEGLDWELTSLVRDHMGAMRTDDGAAVVGATPAAAGTSSGGAGAGAAANASSAAASSGHDASNSTARDQQLARQQHSLGDKAAAATDDKLADHSRSAAVLQHDDSWNSDRGMLSGGGVVYVRNGPDSSDESDND